MKSDDVSLRAAGTADIDVIASIWRAAWASANPAVADLAQLHHWRKRVTEEFGAPCSVTVVSREREVIGFVVTTPSQRYVNQFFVLPSAQGVGVGSWLLAQIKVSFEAGFTLHVSKTNLRAQRFYEVNGMLKGAESVNPQSGRERVEYIYAGQTRETHNAV
jgi:putative acetyltransferase